MEILAMKSYILCLFFSALTLTLTGCFSTAYTIPEAGTEVSKDDLIADVRGNYYLDLSNRSAVRYNGFSISRTDLYPLRVYVQVNNKNYADWRVDPLVWDGGVMNAMASTTVIPPALLPNDRNQSALTGFCRGKYRNTPDAETFSINFVTIMENVPAVEYRLTGKSPQGDEWLIRGYMFFMPNDPGRLFDMNYFLLRKGDSVDKLNLFGERFLESITFD